MRRYHRWLWLLAVGQVVVFIALALWPINSFMVRAPMIFLAITLWATVVALGWNHRILRSFVIILPVLAMIALLLPARAVQVEDLRERVVAALRQYEGVVYLWGGENAHGIDCSGLVRRARMDAEWSYAFAHADPAAVRRALSIWWNDQSAQAMGRHDRGTTVFLEKVSSLSGCPPERYLPGDFAILNEIHVVAALGNGVWIEADPSQGRVLVLPFGSENAWLKVPATLVRWQILTEP
jgi:NlpC/P60 family